MQTLLHHFKDVNTPLLMLKHHRLHQLQHKPSIYDPEDKKKRVRIELTSFSLKRFKTAFHQRVSV